MIILAVINMASLFRCSTVLQLYIFIIYLKNHIIQLLLKYFYDHLAFNHHILDYLLARARLNESLVLLDVTCINDGWMDGWMDGS